MKRVRVVAGLIARDGRYFAQQRLPKGPRGGLWEFPGGKVEPGEDERAALARELREELAIEVRVGDKLAENAHEYSDVIIELVLYAATIESGELRPSQAQAVRWGTARELRDLAFAEADVPFLELLK